MMSSFHRRLTQAPWGVVGMITLIVAVETFETRHVLAHTSLHGTSWRLTGEQVRGDGRRAEVVCLGDSLVKFGVYPEVIESVTGKKAFNFAMTSGPSPAAYFVFRRILNHRRRAPRVVIVDSAAGVLDKGPRSKIRPYPWADLLTLREASELAWQSGEPDLFVQIVIDQVLHSRKNRFEIRHDVLTALNGSANWLREQMPGVVRNWIRNRGAQVTPKMNFKADAYPPVGQHKGNWECDPVNRFYLEKMFELAEQRGTTVFWLLPPFHPVTQAYARFRGEDTLLTGFVREVQTRHPKVIVVDVRDSAYDATVFYDEVHLDLDGGTALSLSLADLINALPGNAGECPRWVKLTDYRPPTRRLPLEHLFQSCDIARALGTARR